MLPGAKRCAYASTTDGPLEALHGFFGAQDRLAERMILPEILGKDFVDEIVGIIFVHLDLFDDHAAFADDVGGIEDGIQNQVAQNIERGGDMLVEHLDVEADAFLGGEGVHVAADGIDLARDFFRRAVLGPFEDHVLDEMGDAVPFGIFVARSGLQPNADGSRADVLHLLGNDGQAVGQFLTTNIADFLSHGNFLLTRETS